MKRTILTTMLVLCCIGGVLVADFTFEESLVRFQLLGKVHTTAGESWRCPLNWQGSQGVDILIKSDNLPDGMWIDNDANNFGWVPTQQDNGLHYIDFTLGRQVDPNNFLIADRMTVVVFVDPWADRPSWQPIGPCNRQ